MSNQIVELVGVRSSKPNEHGSRGSDGFPRIRRRQICIWFDPRESVSSASSVFVRCDPGNLNYLPRCVATAESEFCRHVTESGLPRASPRNEIPGTVARIFDLLSSIRPRWAFNR